MSDTPRAILAKLLAGAPRPRSGRRRRRAAFTIIEVVVATALMGLTFCAAMAAVAASVQARHIHANRARGEMLAEDLLSEVLHHEYKEPSGTGVVFGPESGETLSGSSRAAFDDVDDFHNYSDSPPRRTDGSTMPDLDGWSRRVEVAWAEAEDLGKTSATESYLKRVRVTVSLRDKPVATMTTVVSDVTHYPTQ